MKKDILFATLFLAVKIAFTLPLQINGYVKDKATGELLPNACLSMNSDNFAISANTCGHFSF